MVKLQIDNNKKGATKKIDLVDKIMEASGEEKKENTETETGAMTKREKIQKEDFEDESMFACPICENLVNYGERFSHLDQCTQNI